MALRSHSLALSVSDVYCFCSFFSSAIAIATAFFASTSCCCISSSTCESIFSGSSALVMRLLMFDLISVPSLEKMPMASVERTGSMVSLQRSHRACYAVCSRRKPDNVGGVRKMSETRRLPRHVGIIMDGNGRWAETKGRPRLEGHRAGADSVRDVTRASRQLGIEGL